MVTDDIEIDRRIVQEAATLVGNGYEVTLLAPFYPDCAGTEKRNGLVIERIAPATRRSTMQIQAFHSRGINRLNQISKTSQHVVVRLLTLNEAPVRQGAPKPPIWRRLVRYGWRRVGRRIYRMLVRLTLKAILACLKATAMALNRVVRLVLRVDGRFRDSSGQERGYLDRISALRPDIIHVHDLPQLHLGVAGKKRFSVSLIYDAHELYPEIHTLTPDQRRRLTRQERVLIRHCDHVLTVNPFIAQEMEERYGIRRPEVILNAVDSPLGLDKDAPPDRFRGVLGLGGDDVIVLYQGWLAGGRGLEKMVRSITHLPDSVHLVFLGYGDGRANLEKVRDELNAADRVHFLDAVAQEELLWWSASADIGVIPYQPVDLNNYYCSPNKLFEYIQAHVPILANDLPFLRSIVDREAFGLVVPFNDPIDFARGIRQMLDNGLARYRENLENQAHLYSWKAQEPFLLQAYEHLLAPAPRSAG